MLNITDPYKEYATRAIQQSYVNDLSNRERARMDLYIKTREYDDGIHNTQLTDRAKKYLHLQSDEECVANYCRMIIDAKADRLKVLGFDAADDTQKAWLLNLWRKNRMDAKQSDVHRSAIRDGDCFVLVEWDTIAKMPRFHYEPAYAGSGVMVYYSEERRDEIEFASKSWQTQHGMDTGKKRRVNLYFANRIEKYVSHDDVRGGTWMPYSDGADVIADGKLGQAGVYWWTDTRTPEGNPLGVPIVHFRHNGNGDSYGTSHIADVMPIQDAVNKALIDLLAACDANGFPLFVGLGNVDWSTVKVGPGAVAGIPLDPDKASLDILQGFDPTGLLSVYNALIMEMARVSGTPLAYFQVSGQSPAEGTMKQQEVALVSQVKKTQTNFGNSWEDCFTIARRLENAFGDSGIVLDTDVLIDTIWEQAESRNDKEQTETLAIQVEKLGVSKEAAQMKLGYDATDVAKFARAERRTMALDIRRQPIVPVIPQAGTDTENLTQTENGNVDGAASGTAIAA